MLGFSMGDLVECYSGHTYADRPTAFVCRGIRHQVARITKQWRSPDGSGFIVITSKGAKFELFYRTAQDEWSVREVSCSRRQVAHTDPKQNITDRKENPTDA
jgi:hypothetical protein